MVSTPRVTPRDRSTAGTTVLVQLHGYPLVYKRFFPFDTRRASLKRSQRLAFDGDRLDGDRVAGFVICAGGNRFDFINHFFGSLISNFTKNGVLPI